MRPSPAAALVVGLVLTSQDARADEPRASPYQFRLALDVPLVGLSLAGASAAFIEPLPPPCLPASCEPPASMNALDRRVLGYHSPAAHTAADIVVAALLVAPHVANLVVTRGKDAAWLEDLTISMESVLLAQAFTQITKAAVGRYAPIVYDERVPLEERMSKDALGSFWSGHTATAFSAATSFAVSYWLRHPRDPWRWVVLATLESTALAVGMMKIRAGYHYPTDIFAGALAGISTGLLVPALHHTF
ncbi:MAG: Membrane-associated phospholipid phosphatase [Labilithrix sp.]|nr:Membrane-associated phospholipid phosphatase [Labilithrix sp.]